MNKSSLFLVCFILVNFIPVKQSWKADCVWCAATHDQPLFFKGYSVGFPFHWRTYGIFEYDLDSKFEDIIQWEAISPNFCLMVGIYLLCLGYEYRARALGDNL